MNYTEFEGKVREATNDEAWGPTGALMQELAHVTFSYEHFPEVMSMLWKRMLQDNKQHWRRTYKVMLKFYLFEFFYYFLICIRNIWATVGILSDFNYLIYGLHVIFVFEFDL